jgi:hypothetical protein
LQRRSYSDDSVFSCCRESVRTSSTGIDNQAGCFNLVGLLVDAYSMAGHYSDAMKTVEDEIAMAKATGECFYNAELYRLQGELIARSAGETRQAEASFRIAVKIAGEQGAVTLERKARESLRAWGG